MLAAIAVLGVFALAQVHPHVGFPSALALPAVPAPHAPLLARQTPANATPPDLEPLTDSFYDQPPNLKTYAPGTVLRRRDIQSPVTVNDSVASAEQVVYRTTNTEKYPSWSVATVFKPLKPSLRNGTSNLLSLQLYEDSANSNCAPSQWLVKGDKADLTYGPDMQLWLAWALANGWYVVVPDHEGPRSAFMGGNEEGPAVLDAIRASLNATSLNASTLVGLYGYSGGAHATAWAANYATSYAPDLHIAGASHAGTPVDLASEAQFIDATPNSGLLPSAIAGLLDVYPVDVRQGVIATCDVELRQVLSDAGDHCGLQVAQMDANKSISALCNSTSGFNLWDMSGSMGTLLANESLLTNVSAQPVSVPAFPRLIQHGQNDTTVIPQAARAFVEQQCSQPNTTAQIQWFEWPGLDHYPTSIQSIPAAMQFFLRVFNGSLPSVPCGAAPVDMLTLKSPDLNATVGPDAAQALLLMAQAA